MRVRFEDEGHQVAEVTFPHAELPIGESMLIDLGNGHGRHRFAVLSVDMLVERGELFAIVSVVPQQAELVRSILGRKS